MNKKHAPGKKPASGAGKLRQKTVVKPTGKAGAQPIRQTIPDQDRHNGSGGAFEATEMGHNDE